MRTLQSACVRTIVITSWKNRNMSPLLAKGLVKSDGQKKKYEQTLEHYYNEVSKTLLAIQKQKWPEPVKVMVGFQFIKIERIMFAWAEMLNVSLLKKHTFRNLCYCLSKTVLGDESVDRETSILNIMFHSNNKVEFHLKNLADYCCITKKGYDQYLEANNVIKKPKKSSLNRSILKEIGGIINQEYPYGRFDAFTNFDKLGYKINDITLLVELLKSYPKMHHNFHITNCKGSVDAKESDDILSEVLLDLVNKKGEASKIIFLLDNIGEEERMNTFRKCWREIVLSIYTSEHAHKCVTYYNEIIRSVYCDDFPEVFAKFIELIFFYDLPYEDHNTMFYNKKRILIELWCETPAEAKQKLKPYLRDMLSILLDCQEYYLMSIILNDEEFSDIKKDLVTFFVLDLVNGNVQKDIEQFLSVFPTYTVDIIKEHAEVLYKTYSTENIQNIYNGLVSNFIFGYEKKEYDIKDKDLVVSILVALSSSRHCSPEKVAICLEFICGGRKKKLNKLLKCHIIGQLWIVDAYHNILQKPFPQPNLLDALLGDKESARKIIKSRIRENKEIIYSVLDDCLVNNLRKITPVMNCLFEPDELTQKNKFIQDYLLSKRGLKHLYVMITNCRMDTRREVYKGNAKSFREQFLKFRKYWLCSDELIRVLAAKLSDPLIVRDYFTHHKFDDIPTDEEKHSLTIQLQLIVFVAFVTDAMNYIDENDTTYD